MLHKQSHLLEVCHVCGVGCRPDGRQELSYRVRAPAEWIPKTTRISGRGGKPTEHVRGLINIVKLNFMSLAFCKLWLYNTIY